MGMDWIAKYAMRDGGSFTLRVKSKRSSWASKDKRAFGGPSATVSEAEVGEIQFFGNDATGLETLPGSALCECFGLLKTYPGKFDSIA